MNTSDVYRTFFHSGEVCEIRAYGLSKNNRAWEGWAGGEGVVYGYFDNGDDFGRCADALEAARAAGIYFTLNPVNPDLLARANNRLKAVRGKKNPLTSDRNIQCIRWIPIDLDPRRPSGISSSESELKAAFDLAAEITRFTIKEFAVTPGVVACSGNGMHLVYRLPDLGNTEENVWFIRSSLEMIARNFEQPAVDIDLKVFNPSRIWKLYGTTGRKGDHTPTRPHRKSYIISVAPEGLTEMTDYARTNTDQLRSEG